MTRTLALPRVECCPWPWAGVSGPAVDSDSAALGRRAGRGLARTPRAAVESKLVFYALKSMFLMPAV